MTTRPYWLVWYKEFLDEWERLVGYKLEADVDEERRWFEDYYMQGYEPKQACAEVMET